MDGAKKPLSVCLRLGLLEFGTVKRRLVRPKPDRSPSVGRSVRPRPGSVVTFQPTRTRPLLLGVVGSQSILRRFFLPINSGQG